MNLFRQKEAPTILCYRFAAGLVCLLPLVIGFWHDIFRPYTVSPDADLIYLGQALRLADGLGQTYFDHTGHSYILILYSWLELWALTGFIPHPSQLAAINSEDIDAYIQPLVVAGRGLSLFMGMVFAILVMWGARCLQLSRIMSLVVGILFAVSQGLTAQTLIMRAEILSAMGVFIVFFALVRSQQARGRAHVFWIMLAGVSTIVALDAKVQAVIVLLGLPILALALGVYRIPGPSLLDRSINNTPAVIFFSLAAGVPFLSVVGFTMAASQLRGPWTGYQGLVVLLILGSLLVYGRIYREPAIRQILSASVLLAGFSIGSSILFIWHNYRLMDAIVHFVEHMVVFMSPATTKTTISGEVLGGLLVSVLDARTSNLFSPMGLIEVSSLIVLCVLLWRGEIRKALLIFLMLGLTYVIQAIFGLRSHRLFYYIYVETWLILALSIGLQALLPWKKQITKILFSVAVISVCLWAAMFSLEDRMIPRQALSNVCEQARTYLAPPLAVRFSAYCIGSFNSAN